MAGPVLSRTPVGLPDQAATGFDLLRHSFRFGNCWTGQLVPSGPHYGLCGGMAHAACDAFVADQPTPAAAACPAPGSPLWRYLWRRQLGSLRAKGWLTVRRLTWWMIRGRDATGRLTGIRLERAILPRLAAGEPVPLCLVRTRIGRPLNLVRAFSVNHQVLAIGYRRHLEPGGEVHWDVDVYDPNHPGQVHTLHCGRDVRVQTRRAVIRDGRLELVPEAGRADRNVVDGLRGCFETPYRYSSPPWGIRRREVPQPEELAWR